MNVLSLFDGISCGMVALERAGIKVSRYVSYEIDDNAIKVSKKNYPTIERMGNCINANFEQFNGFDILIGGSPCTYWSIARRADRPRETEASGLGYELFMKYSLALKTIKPKYFIYENNKSISQEIKDAITKELGVKPILINSALVSGQNRNRMYWTNIPNVCQPIDKKIMFYDIIKKEREWFPLLPWCLKAWGDKIKVDTLKTIESNKSSCLTTNKSHPKNYYLNKERNLMTKLDAEEFEILQTLPVGYTDCVSEGHRIKQLGNGWTVDVIVHILSFINKGESTC